MQIVIVFLFRSLSFTQNSTFLYWSMDDENDNSVASGKLIND